MIVRPMSDRRSMTCRSNAPRRFPRRRGSTLIIVIALLASLMLLGFLFLTIASQEQENAYLFAEAAKEPQTAGTDCFGFALEQLILGPREDLYNSALWGGRSSLLPTMFGYDLQPYNGAGVNLAWQSGTPGFAVVDQDWNAAQDNAADNQLLNRFDDDLLSFNLSPGAWWADGTVFPGYDLLNGEVRTTTGGLSGLPAPDVEYTYPDLASPFLAFVTYEPTTGQRVVIPSFHRPQYLRDLATRLSVPPTDWYANPDTARRSMRPHRAHIAITERGNSSGETRFESDASSLDAVGDPVTGTPGIGVFPFEGSFNGTDFTTVSRDEGVWWGNDTDPTYDMDADNDGLREAVLIDLDYPVQVSADGQKTFVPLFAITVYDADALFNLNAHGNAFGDLAMHDGSNPVPFGDADGNGFVNASATENDYISRSNQAIGPHEVNAAVGLDATVGSAGSGELDPHTQFFLHTPASDVELANMEWWFVLTGRAEIDPAAAGTKIKALYPGRWGEDGRLRVGAAALVDGGDRVNAPRFFPYPGFSGQDDTARLGASPLGEGHQYVGTDALQDTWGGVFPVGVTLPAERHPLDRRGQGRFVERTPGGKTRLFQTFGRFQLPAYADYVVPDTLNWRAISIATGIPLVSPATVADYANAFSRFYSVTSGTNPYLIDHPNETTLGTSSPNSGQDSIFSPGESATLALSDSDRSVISFSQRLLTLVPYNFDKADEAQDRRKMFTTASADVKTHGSPVRPDAEDAVARAWEYTDPDGAGPIVASFPPTFPSVVAPQTQPFRQEAGALLRGDLGGITPATAQQAQTLMRKLSVNHVAEQVTNPRDPAFNRIRLRPLTPHPGTALAATAVVGPITSFGVPDVSIPSGWHTWDMTTAVQQEWNARRDRQNLARDIYVLLYTLGKSNSTTTNNPVNQANDPLNDTSGPVYSLAELREMAQFAVNLVDAMDADDNISCFAYDLNLRDGYTPFDDGYTNPIDPLSYADADPAVDADGDGVVDNDHYDATNNRGIVYGVETQRLTLGEAMFVLAKKIDDGTGMATEDRSVTEWNDEEVRDFSYIELINVAPENIDFSLGQWQIAVRPPLASQPPASPSATTLTTVATERRITPIAGGVGTGAAAVYSIAAAGDDHNRERASPSEPYDVNDPLWIAPASRMRINPTEPASTVDSATEFSLAWLTVAPFVDASLDLLNAPPTSYRINEATPTGSFFRDGDVEGGYRRYTAPTTPDSSDPDFADDGLLFLGDETARDLIAEDESTGSLFVTVELRRRLNVSRTAPDATGTIDEAISKDNPWIVVDRMKVPLQILKLLNTDETTTLQTHFQGMQSRERINPLWRNPTSSEITHTANPPMVPTYVGNSLGDFYATSPAPFTLWQPHFNRPFASLGEILSVPLYSPGLLTGLSDSTALNNDIGLVRSESGNPVLNRTRVAAARVLFPDGGSIATVPPAGMYNNLWYRAFEYISVPEADGGTQQYPNNPWFTVDAGFPAVNDQLRRQGQNVAGPYQRFGKLNLNTIRHPHVLAGMIDDFSVVGRPAGQTLNSSWLMQSMATEARDDGQPRRWWFDFLVSRDGYDPYTGMVLPGLPVGRMAGGPEVIGRPFRSTSTALRVEGGSNASFGDVPEDMRRSLGDTIFRRLPGTALTPGLNSRGLFELGTTNEVDAATFDYTTRYRLLSKVLNHSTTRSNVFHVFIQVAYFNAKVKYDSATGERYVRIGECDDEATAEAPRAFFVIDRSKALELISSSDLPARNEYVAPGQSVPTITSSFARSADGAPTFDWRKLVVSELRIR